jgi:DNA modification methylase
VNKIEFGDCRETMRIWTSEGVKAQMCVTSPPYFGLRDYGHAEQIGLEQTPDAYVAELVALFREVRRVLRDDGTLWLNLGDSYAANRTYQVPSTKGGPKHGPGQSAGGAASVVPDGLKPKDLLGIPWRFAFALQSDGWYLRSDIIWHKPNPMPESVTDRPTKAHEYVFLLSKSARYFYDAAAIAEGVTADMARRAAAGHTRGQGKVDASRNDATTVRPTLITGDTRNARTVWSIKTKPFKGAHFATMPPALAERCIKAGTKPGDMVLDPFGGAGTTGLVADRLGRDATLIELNPTYAAMARARLTDDSPLFVEVTS